MKVYKIMRKKSTNRSSVHGTLYTVHYTVYSVQCTLYTVQCTLYTVHCILCTVYTVHSLYLYIVYDVYINEL